MLHFCYRFAEALAYKRETARMEVDLSTNLDAASRTRFKLREPATSSIESFLNDRF
jgi:hypothetical protein